MNTLYICRGLPASGKTFWARQFVADPTSRACRVNRDDLRTMAHNGQFSTWKEMFIFRSAMALIVQGLMHGYDVVSDDTNLQTHTCNELFNIAKVCNRPIHWVMFETPINVCIARDKKRANSVGEAVIRKMHETMGLIPDELLAAPTMTVYPGDVYHDPKSDEVRS